MVLAAREGVHAVAGKALYWIGSDTYTIRPDRGNKEDNNHARRNNCSLGVSGNGGGASGSAD
jgi:hypothetical protein